MRNLSFCFIFLCCLISISTLAQSTLTGNWTGTLYQNPKEGLKWSEYKFSIKLEEKNGVVTGVSTIIAGPNFGILDLKGTFKEGILTFEEYHIEKEKWTENFLWCLKSGKLNLSTEGKTLKLQGNWTGYTKTGTTKTECSPGRIAITKEQGFISMKGYIVHENTTKETSAQVKVVNKTTGKQVTNFNTSTGEFDIKLPGNSTYEVTVEARGYLPYHETVTLTASKILNIPVVPIEVGKAVTLSNVLFERSTSNLTKDSYPALERLYKFLSSHPSVRIQLQGHTSNEGDPAKNVELSSQRVKAIKQVLVKKGIADSRIELKAFGGEKPIVANDTEENKKLNRRVEFVILTK